MRWWDRIAIIILIACAFLAAGCRARPAAYTADVLSGMPNAGLPQLSGQLYLSGNHIRVDWGSFADVFDLKQRRGWRISADTKTYQELGSKDLSTYAPEMTDGSLCSHTQVPSRCNLVGTEAIEGRNAKKWDVYNPNGFHVYFWTDEQLGITVRMAMGDTTSYQLRNLRPNSVSGSTFELPSGYERVQRSFKP
jgi:hypothetical protein